MPCWATATTSSSANVERNGALASGASYNGSLNYAFGPAFSRHGTIFVKSDATGAVWENGSETNNTQDAGHATDVMPIAYADMRVESVGTTGTAYSGRDLTVQWTVANRGIGITNTDELERQRLAEPQCRRQRPDASTSAARATSARWPWATPTTAASTCACPRASPATGS